MNNIDLLPLIALIAQQYVLDPQDLHGLAHWGRVLENGLKLAEHEGGDRTVIRLFAVFHDACRQNQAVDHGHGARAAALAGKLLKDHPQVTPAQLALLQTACEGHTDGRTEGDLSVRICWDSDRLDLARVYIKPKKKYLCTPTARSKKTRDWANRRARKHFAPAFVESDWAPIFSANQNTYQKQ